MGRKENWEGEGEREGERRPSHCGNLTNSKMISEKRKWQLDKITLQLSLNEILFLK